MSISKVFIPNFVCALTNKRYKTYRMEFLFLHLGHAPGLGLGSGGGLCRGSILLNMVMWNIKLTGMMDRTEYKYFFYPGVQL